MTISQGSLQAPLKISEIASVLGESSYTLSVLCKSTKINRWAIYRPIDYNKSTPVTLSERKAINMGLTPKVVSALKDSGTGICTNSYATIKAQIALWSFSLPKGGSSSPYRMSDFLNTEGGTLMQGYNHGAVAPDNDWKSFEAKKGSTINDKPVTNFSFRLNEESASNIGNANSNYMPLSYICSTSGDRWYLGLAIYVPSGNSSEGWMYIRGTKTLSELTSSTIGDAFPSFSTNTYLSARLGNPDSIMYLPCLLKNPQDKKTQDASPKTYISMSTGEVYCMPSGAGKDNYYTITYNTPYSNVSVTNPLDSNIIRHLKESAYVPFPTQNARLAYMVSGTEDSVGSTLKGWFLCCPRVASASSGFYINKLVLVYCERASKSSNWAVSTNAPSSAPTINLQVYCSRLESAGTGSNQVLYEMVSFSGTPSRSSRISISTPNGTQYFYGLLANKEGISLGVVGAR